MLVTEEEAKKLWCAHRRTASYKGNQDFPITTINDHSTCIASGCMSWRKKRKVLRYEPSQNGIAPDKPVMSDEETGYCGLAGDVHE